MLADFEEREAVRQRLDTMRELVKRSWKTLMAVKDPDGKYLRMKNGWCLQVVNDAKESYGWTEARAKFIPTAEDISKMEVVMTWMAWLRREHGDGAVHRIRDWCLGAPVWKMAEWESCSERTIHNRIDRSLTAILAEFMAVGIVIDRIEEPEERSPESFCLERPLIGESGSLDPGKVFVADIGWMYRGKPWNKGEALAAKFKQVVA